MVRGEKLCGSIYAAYHGSPYLHMLPAQDIFKDLNQLLGTSDTRVATPSDVMHHQGLVHPASFMFVYSQEPTKPSSVAGGYSESGPVDIVDRIWKSYLKCQDTFANLEGLEDDLNVLYAAILKADQELPLGWDISGLRLQIRDAIPDIENLLSQYSNTDLLDGSLRGRFNIELLKRRLKIQHLQLHIKILLVQPRGEKEPSRVMYSGKLSTARKLIEQFNDVLSPKGISERGLWPSIMWRVC